MYHFSRLSLISLMLANSTTFAAMPADGWYAGLMGGLSYLNNLNFTVIEPFIVSPVQGSLDYKVLGQGGGQLGYRFCDNFRLEIQLNVSNNPIEKVQVGNFVVRRHENPAGYSLNGQTTFVAGFFNGYYDFFEEGTDVSFVPYVGLGIGYAHFINKLTFNYNKQPIGNSFNESANAPMGQAILGLSYYYSDNTSFGADFRYMTTNTLKVFNTKLAGETFNINFNYSFDEPSGYK